MFISIFNFFKSFFKRRKTKFRISLSNLVKKLNKIKEECISTKEKLKDLPSTNMNLALFHMEKGNISDAIFRFKLVNRFFDKNNFKSYYNLARCYYMKDEPEKALKTLKKSYELNNEDENIDYFFKKIESPDEVDKIPGSFIKEHSKVIFSYGSDLFIDSEFIANRVILNVKDENPKLDILELGCGFGNLGKAFNKVKSVRTLSGLDISEEMIEYAGKLKEKDNPVYDELIDSEALNYVSSLDKIYDIVFVQGVLDYLKNPNDLLVNLFQIIKEEGLCCLLFPETDKEKTEESNFYFDKRKDMFFHSKDYVRSCLEDNGFKILEEKKISVTEEVKATLLISLKCSGIKKPKES